MQTKAKIDFKTGVIELEGSEEFVQINLEKFSSLIHVAAPDRAISGRDAIDLPAAEHQVPEAITRKPSVKTPARGKQSKGPTKSKRIEPTRFDIHKDETTPSLEDFLNQKKPKSTGDVVAVIGYYLMQMKGGASFSEGHIEYVYRTLKLKARPTHLRQIIINNKNERDLFELAGEDGAWTLTRAGEIYVDQKLPALKE